jgi:hypothetical protein
MNLQKRNKKVFTLEEANKALSLVRPITKDILTCLNQIAEIKESYHQVTTSEEQLQTIQLKLVHHLNELNLLNVNLNNLYLGIIDFPMIKDGIEGFYSWKFGEDEICFYREKNADITERKYIYNITKS